ncbi:MAG: ABC transporter permease [Anaerolineales bacterium]|nr:ABC transporter permease [Anaerolineales bacterium]
MLILDIALKDLVRSSRNLFLVGMTLAAPLLITGLMYFAFGGGGGAGGDVRLNPIQVGVVDADVLPSGAPLTTTLGGNVRSLFFDESVRSWISAADYPDAAAARAALDARTIGVAVLIPASFTADYLAGRAGAPIRVVQDPTLTIGPTVVRDMVMALLDGVAGGGIAYQVIAERQRAQGQPLTPAQLPAIFQRYAGWYADFQRALFHAPERAALVLTAPAGAESAADGPAATLMGLVMAGQMIFFSFFTGANAMQSILQEDDEGTLARSFTTPVTRTTILAGKFLAVALTVVIQGVVLMAAARLFFGVAWGQPAAAALSLLGQVAAAVGLGVALIAFIRTRQQAGPVLGGALTALGMLSGLFTTNIAMPAAFAALGNFTPQGWALKAWRLALAGRPADELLLPFVVLVLMGGGLFALGAWRFNRRYA